VEERVVIVVPPPAKGAASNWDERLLQQRSQVRLIYDENLPPSLKMHLGDLFPRSIHVRDINLAHSPDSSIWEHAKAFDFAIMTKDSDFADRVRQEGPPPTVIQIRAGNCSVSKLVGLIRESAPQIITTVQFRGSLLEIGVSAPSEAAAIPE
jgi:predicted nuclease of predicted toxin-antitoxin system